MSDAPPCNPHPDAPHGFNRDRSHSLGRYVCECEGWESDLPPLPEPASTANGGMGTEISYYTPEQMTEYARAAVSLWALRELAKIDRDLGGEDD